MREILFRGKRIDNGEWVEGAFSAWSCDLPFSPKVYKPSIIKYGEPYSGFWFDVYPESVGQYTGLKDKNGTKIYEGDILKGNFDEDNPEDAVIVRVLYDECCFYVKEKIMAWDPLCAEDCEIWEVIGNIYDNPELRRERV